MVIWPYNQLGRLDRLYRLVQNQGNRRVRVSNQPLSFYRFRRILFQRYLYNGLDHNERVYLHEAVGQALETLYGEQTAQLANQLARHFRNAGTPRKGCST
jgi:predicted ATPase